MSASNEVRPERELRLAVVMYGGVSLAVYMNGVAQELLNLVRATAPDLGDPTCCAALYSDDKIRGSSTEIYREIARLPLKEDPSPTSAAIGPIRQRVVIDILTGTSAGGINAIFLAKALANNQSLDGIASLWETEADLDTLINDSRSRSGLQKLSLTGSPRSLLNSRRMYAKLREAFDKMDNKPAETDHPLVDELDLFVTATDLEGLPVRLQLGGNEIAAERSHRKAFRLRFGSISNDFTDKDNPFLAFIARCTSSFPFAFEAMQLSQAIEGCKGEELDIKRWAHHFSEYSAAGSQGQIAERDIARPYGDGGYLDNKPFGYAINTIAARSGGDTARVERKLVFIDPDPERVLEKRSDDKEPPIVPNAVENALAALRLPAYETIREDLLRLSDRNRTVNKIQNVVRGLTKDFAHLDRDQRKHLAEVFNLRKEFPTRDLSAIVALFGAPYGGYHRLKVANLTDEITELVANHLRISLDSDEFRLVRTVVRAWRDAVYSANPVAEQSRVKEEPSKATEFAFLQDMDCSYRVRRLAFVIEQINRISGADALERTETLDAPHVFGLDPAELQNPLRIAELLAALNDRRRQLAIALRTLRDGREALFGRAKRLPLTGFAQHKEPIRAFLEQLKTARGDRERRRAAEELLQRDNAAGMKILNNLTAEIVREVGWLAERARTDCEVVVPEIKRADAEVPVSSVVSEVANNIVRHFYAWYELYDEMIFPISHGTEVGEEVAMVEPVRISPLFGRAAAGVGTNDERLLPAGIGLGHFGAFLSVYWRANDILLGRLNAAKKLIPMILTGVPQLNADEKEKYVRRAQAAIINEERQRLGSLTKKWMDEIPNAGSPEKVLDHIECNGMPRKEVPRERSLAWVTRSVKVTGKVLDAAAKGTAATGVANAFTQAAQLLAAVVEVAVPQRWWGLQLRRWVARLWLYAVALAMLGVLFGKDEMRSLGLTVAGVVSGVGLVAVLLRGWVLRKPWLRRVSLGMLVLTAGLAVVGVIHLWSVRASALPVLAEMWSRVKAVIY